MNESDRRPNKTLRQDKMIVALLENPTLEKAAASIGMSDVTLWRWMRKPEFQNAYRDARRQAFSRAVARLQHASNAAVATLLRIMTDREAPAASRVRAADCVLLTRQSNRGGEGGFGPFSFTGAPPLDPARGSGPFDPLPKPGFQRQIKLSLHRFSTFSA